MTSNTLPNLHLIEPTLFDQTGHGYSYNYSLIKANHQNAHLFNIQLWLDARGKKLFANTATCQPKLYFHKKIRQLQKFFLYRKLLQQPGTIYICTAGITDLAILNLVNNAKSLAKVILHFHQFKQSTKKLRLLSKIAAKNPEFVIFAPTQALVDIFGNQGFRHCQAIPCPTFPRPVDPINLQANVFRKVLYAGAARRDKGFPDVVNFVQHLRKAGNYLPFAIQISPPHSTRYDQHTLMALDKLSALPQENLVLYKHTLQREEYQDLFDSSICLLIYDQASYQDKFSGVALDAFYAGCPVITAKHTWMGDTAERFNAGVTLTKYTPEQLMQAVDLIQNNYHTFSQNALHAASVLATEHDPLNTLHAIFQVQ